MVKNKTIKMAKKRKITTSIKDTQRLISQSSETHSFMNIEQQLGWGSEWCANLGDGGCGRMKQDTLNEEGLQHQVEKNHTQGQKNSSQSRHRYH